MTIAVSDYRNLYRFGVAYTQNKDVAAAVEAAMYYVISEESEQFSVRYEFEEGVRNYAGNQRNIDRIMKDFDEFVESWRSKL